MSAGGEGRARLGEVLVLSRGANSLNVLRLAFACAVIVSHSIPLGGFGNEEILGNDSIGDLAVDGFFGISGYLICASAIRHMSRNGRWRGLCLYLRDRCLRIFPAFWLCLIVTAGGFGIIGWLSVHSSLTGYWGHPLGPGNYIASNFLLRMSTYQISGTPINVPYPLAWDGSLWTLQWEFLCYLGIAALAAVGFLAHRTALLAIAVLLWVVEIAVFIHPLPDHLSAELILRFAPIFLVGALLYLFRDHVPDSGALALALVALAAIGVAMGDPNSPDHDWLTGPAFVYPILWLGAHLPLRKFGATNDISYGVYIYGFVVGQFLAIEGIQRYGYGPFMISTLVLTIPLACGSWWGVEKRALAVRSRRPKAWP